MSIDLKPFALSGHSTINPLDHSLFTAEPTEGVASMVTEFRELWILELLQLIAFCEECMSIDLSWARVRASSLTANRGWSPAVFSAIADLRIGVGKSDVTLIMDSLAKFKNLSQDDIYDDNLRISSILTESWEQDFIPYMRAYEPLGKCGEKTLVLPILGMDLSVHCKAIGKALALIQSVDQLIFNEFQMLVTRIKLFQGRVLRGETNTHVYGAIFFRLPPVEYNHIVYWVEHLVHEISHLRLELLRIHDPLVNNDLAPVFQAPFRRDPRPMLGVFHATFVIARMMRVLRKLSQAGTTPLYRERYNSISERFKIGLVSLEKDGKFTSLGQQIVHSLARVAYG